MKFRNELHRQFDPDAWKKKGISDLNKILLLVVLASIAIAVLETEQQIVEAAPDLFKLLTALFAVLFTVEYALRFWAMGLKSTYKGWHGRLRYLVNPFALLDLAAVAGLWLDLLVGSDGLLSVLLRLARVLRIISLGRNTAFAAAIHVIWKAVKMRSVELTLSLVGTLFALFIASTLMYFVERQVQPDAFGSIPRSMWWAVVTLTTVGYGDVFPVTVIGKVLAGVVALTSIAMIALPAGILAAAFSDAFHDLRGKKSRKPKDS